MRKINYLDVNSDGITFYFDDDLFIIESSISEEDIDRVHVYKKNDLYSIINDLQSVYNQMCEFEKEKIKHFNELNSNPKKKTISLSNFGGEE